MKFKIFKLIVLYIGINLTSLAQDNLEDLEFLRGEGIITQEEYDILKGKKEVLDGKYLYEIRVNGNLESKVYEVLKKHGKNYFPLKEFFKIIKFNNYTLEGENKLKGFLGEDLREINIDLTNEEILKIDGDFYIEEELFKEIFLRSLRVDEENFKMNMFLNFSSPGEIENTLERTKEKLQDKEEANNLVYTNERVPFEIGYLRTKIDKIYSKNSGESFENTWDGSLEYEGAFLYGQLITAYDLKNRDFQDTKIIYGDLWRDHTLEIGSYSTEPRGTREWGGSFKKDKGYLITKDKVYVIRENVPIGSRVELLYMGIPIDVQDSINGVVTFENDEIKGDREYILKIYEADGKISLKKIDTASDYNQQNKGQIEYNMDFREVSQGDRVRLNSKIYYGLSDHTTLGLEYSRDVEEREGKYDYLNGGKLEVIYSNYIYSYPYTLVLGKEKTLEKLDDKSKGKFEMKGQIDIDKFRLKIRREEKENYYREKIQEEYSLEYRPINNLTLKYELDKRKLYSEKEEENKNYGISYSKSYKNFLVSGDYEKSTFNGDKYMMNFYYSGFRNFTTKWENTWENEGKDYEGAFSVFNSSSRNFDYSMELRYSPKNKGMVTFKFNCKLDNWFNFNMAVDKLGNQEYKFGLDRIIDLKNPSKNIDNMDSSRVKVITFVDSNNNNHCDHHEKKVENVKVKIGKKEVITDENGEGIFYGIPNHMVYDLNPIIRKPNFLLGKNKIQVKGRSTSTLEAYIPLKPMLTLRGLIKIDSDFTKNENQKMEIYRDILIRIKDKKNKVLDVSMADEEGIFEIAELLPGEYILEMDYMGEFYRIKSLRKNIQLDYDENIEKNNFIFNIEGEGIGLNE
ncbi:MAG: hypothetical protein ACRC1R_04975 [Cetobacterium sp.]|uniref:hypothetical protein n=1 Tax=Cetobacterium sp. TaxID=2071632 RepID=UPI003F2D7C36